MALPHKLRWAGTILAVIAYAIIANYTNQSTQHNELGVLVAIAPIVLTIVFLMWKSRYWLVSQRIGLVGLVVIGIAALLLAWPQLKLHYGWIYWLEHESLQLILFITFARTLAGDRKPLCTQFAQIMHGTLSPAHENYAKKVTFTWALFFCIMIIISSILFFKYPISVWSIFANFLYLPLTALMFLLEFIVRKHTLPDVVHTNFMDTVRVFMNRTKH